MPDTPQLLAFIAAGLLLNLTPGPDVFLVVTQAARGGVRAGLAAALGIAAGCCVHIAAAALGVGALIAASAGAFTALKWLGAAYLVYVGVSMLRAPTPAPVPDSVANKARPTGGSGGLDAREPLGRVLRRGFWTNALNPKVALFFLAFVPQFIAPGAPHATRAFLALGLLFNFNALWVNFGWAVGAAWMARRAGALRHGAALRRGLERAVGAVFIGFALKLALSDAPPPPPGR